MFLILSPFRPRCPQELRVAEHVMKQEVKAGLAAPCLVGCECGRAGRHGHAGLENMLEPLSSSGSLSLLLSPLPPYFPSDDSLSFQRSLLSYAPVNHPFLKPSFQSLTVSMNVSLES